MEGNKKTFCYGEIAIKDDCEMYNDMGFKDKNGCCRGLKQLYCRNEKCNFYKPLRKDRE